VLCTLVAFAFARFDFAGRDIAFALVLLQLMIMPEVLIVENYRSMSRLGLVETTDPPVSKYPHQYPNGGRPRRRRAPTDYLLHSRQPRNMGK
jgi:hypothetical protein